MQNLLFGLTSYLISLLAFGFGAVKLFKKRIPLYFQILTCAAGCFSIQQLSYLVNIWCDIEMTASIGMLGIFGCNFFLLSANYGALDGIVDDGKCSDKARSAAIIAPVIMAILTALAFLIWKDKDMFFAVMLVIMFLPALPASYYNLKHLLLPTDPFAFLRATKPCNIMALIFYVVMAMYVIALSQSDILIGGILQVLMALSILVLTVYATRGAKTWGI